MTETTCRQCGVIDTEDADDPCPGICPSCLADRMEAATWYLKALLLSLPLGEALTEASWYLREAVELTETATEEMLAGLRAEVGE